MDSHEVLLMEDAHYDKIRYAFNANTKGFEIFFNFHNTNYGNQPITIGQSTSIEIAGC